MEETEKETFTVRSVAKDVVSSIVTIKTADFAKDLMTDYTRCESDDLFVRVSTGIIGGIVATKLRPLTDKMVDVPADFIVAKRAARKARRKEAEEATKKTEE